MADWLPSRPFYRFGLALLRASTETSTVRDVLGEIVPLTGGTRLQMRFPGGLVVPPVEGADRLRAVLAEFDRRFPEFLSECGVRLEQVSECSVVVTRGSRGGLRYAVEVTDYRGWNLGVQIVFPPTATPSAVADPHVVVTGLPEDEPPTSPPT